MAAPSEASPKNRLRGRSPRSNRNTHQWAVGFPVTCLPSVIAGQVRVFHVRAPASPAQRILGGGFGRGAKPPSEWLKRVGQDFGVNFWNVWQASGTWPRLTAKVHVTSLT